ncbi:MAG: putative DNA binding domain-containing protein [Chloroflexi bacterium]|nr:putative DNA binding domain-containing protein [Chloroflexota bacterium]
MVHRKKSSQREWRRMDLHLHTPASIDYKQPNVTYLDFLKKAEDKNLDVIAFADHNSANGYARYLEEIESLELLERLNRLRDDERKRLEEYRRLRDKILVLPGFEFTATLGFHILGIFPPETTVRELEHLLLSLRVPSDKLDQGSGEVGATTDALTAYRMINEAGGLVIAAHANSSHGVAMPGFDFGGQTRIAYTQDSNLHALEVTDLDSKSRRRTAAFFSGTKPEYPRRMHCIQGSDAHKLDFDPRYKNEMGLGDRATEILLDDISFEAIKQVFVGSDFSRTRPYRPTAVEPFDPLRDAREQGDTLIQAFHERLIEKRGIERGILEDIVALANTNGGTVYVGASAVVKTPVVGVDRPEHAISDLRGSISKDITPPLEVQIEVLKSQGRNVLQLIVPRGSDVPYALGGSNIFVRSENETALALRDEIVQLVRDALAVEFAAITPTAPAELAAAPAPALLHETQPAETKEQVVLAVDPPRTGVEIVSSEVRKGVRYYSVRDLRNARVVHNVTLASARRLWQYAIEEHEKNPCDPKRVQWLGDIGVWKAYKRGGKARQDLVQRAGGKVVVYYGVTEDGIHGPWRKLVEGESAGEGDESSEAESQEELGVRSSVVPSGVTVAAEEEPEVEISESLADEPPEETYQMPAAQADVYETEPEELTDASYAQLELEAEEEPAVDAEPALAEPFDAPEPAAEPPPPEAESTYTNTQSPQTAKTRAQLWREKLDRAMAATGVKADHASGMDSHGTRPSSAGPTAGAGEGARDLSAGDESTSHIPPAEDPGREQSGQDD